MCVHTKSEMESLHMHWSSAFPAEHINVKNAGANMIQFSIAVDKTHN